MTGSIRLFLANFFFLFLIFVASFFPLSLAISSEDWVELDDPRVFLEACSFDTAKNISFEEAALSYDKHISECVKITGYYSAAFYDGPEGFAETNGDEWYGVTPEILQRNRMGLYFPVDHKEYFLEDPRTEKQAAEQNEYWDKKYGAEQFERRNVTLAANVYSCEKWLEEAGKSNEDQNFLFGGYCYYAEGAIVVVHDWGLVEGQDYDPVLDLGPDKLSEDWEIIGPSFEDLEPACQWESAEQVNFEDVALKPYLYSGKCVRVIGLSVGSRSFYSSLTGYYLSARHGYQNIYPNRIGVYLTEDLFESRSSWFDERIDTEMLGRVKTCDKLGSSSWQQTSRHNDALKLLPPDDSSVEQVIISMVGGYCHYYLGTVMGVVDMREFRVQSDRLIGQDNREEFGNLSVVENNWEHREAFLKAAADFLAEELLEEVQKPSNPERSPLQRFLKHQERVGEGNVDFALFLKERDPYSSSFIESAVCYCLEESCSGKWPISTVDIQYEPRLPYMCVFVDNGAYTFLEEVDYFARARW